MPPLFPITLTAPMITGSPLRARGLAYGYALLLAFAGSTKAGEAVFELPFWPGPRSDADPAITRRADGPCGPVVYARVSAMPPLGRSGALQTDRAVELGADGAVVHRWPLPANARPLAIDGDQLLFAVGDRMLRVDGQGGLRAVAVPPRREAMQIATCRPPDDFGSSAYVRCARFKDPVSGAWRVLAYEGPCS